jgi:hypothetical protein
VTNREACEWVHRQLIVDELDIQQLVAVFTVLAERAPNGGDRRFGMFRTCCEIVLLSVPPAPPTAELPREPSAHTAAGGGFPRTARRFGTQRNVSGSMT